MLRTFLTIAMTLIALPALLAAQQSGTTGAAARHGTATRFLGEVVRPAEGIRTAGDINRNPSKGEKVEDQKDAQEGPDVDENHDGHEGQDSDLDEGPNGHEGPDVDEGAKGRAQSQGDGDKEDTEDHPPSASGPSSSIGRHRP